MKRRTFLTSLLGTAGALAAPAVHASAPQLLTIACPSNNWDYATFREFIDNSKMILNFRPFNNYMEIDNELLSGKFVGDIIIHTMPHLSRYHGKKKLSSLNFNNIYRYKKPEFTLVGQRAGGEFESIISLGMYYNGLAYNKNDFSGIKPRSWANVFEPADKKIKSSLWHRDIYDIVRIASIYLGLGANPTKETAEKVKKFLYDSKAKFNLAVNSMDSLSTLKSNIVHTSSSNFMRQPMADKQNYDFIMPNEGTLIDEVACAIPDNCRDKLLAEKFLNFMVQPVINKNFVTLGCLTNQCTQTKNLLPKEYTENKIIYPQMPKDYSLYYNTFISEENTNIIADIARAII